MSLTLVTQLELLGIKVYIDEYHVDKHSRYVHKPFRKLHRKHMLLENYAFTYGESIPVETFVQYINRLRGSDVWELVDIIVAPDAVLKPARTLELHRRYVELVPEDVLIRSLAVVQETRLSKLTKYVRELCSMGFRKVAIPSENVAALSMLPHIAKYFEYVHVLGRSNTAIEHVLKYRQYIDSIDFTIDAHQQFCASAAQKRLYTR